MQGTKLQVTITRNNNEVDDNFDYTKEIIYKDISCYMIEIGREEFSKKISQAETESSFTFYFDTCFTNIKVGDTLTYDDEFGEMVLKVTNRPKIIHFEESSDFIKITAKIGV